MADNFLSSPATPGGATFASDEISSVHYPRSKLIHGVDGTNAGDVSSVNPLPVRDYTVSPQVSYATSSSVAAGGSAVLQSAQVTSAKTAYLVGVYVSSSVPFKAELATVSNGVASSTKKLVGFSRDLDWYFRPPGREFFSVAHDSTAGFDGFQVIVTNLTTGTTAADFYMCVMYDEI